MKDDGVCHVFQIRGQYPDPINKSHAIKFVKGFFKYGSLNTEVQWWTMLQIIIIWVVSYMGSVPILANPTRPWQTPILLMTVELFRLTSWPMRAIEIDNVTPFRPITRLNFWILEILRGTRYNFFVWGLTYVDGVCKKFNYDNVNFEVDHPPPTFWEKFTFWFVCGVFPLWGEQKCIWV